MAVPVSSNLLRHFILDYNADIEEVLVLSGIKYQPSDSLAGTSTVFAVPVHFTGSPEI